MKRNLKNGSGTCLRRPSRIPQYPQQFILPFAVQEDFAARLVRLKAEGKLPKLCDVLRIVKREIKR